MSDISCRFKVARGPIKWLLYRLKVAGITMPWRTIYIIEDYFRSITLRHHELVHIEQLDRMGAIRWFAVICYQFFYPGYPNGELEMEARKRERMQSDYLRKVALLSLTSDAVTPDGNVDKSSDKRDKFTASCDNA